MKKFNGIYASLLVTIFIRLALLCIPGCNSPDRLAGSANASTHRQTTSLAATVNKAQTANAAADAEVVAIANDPRIPEDARIKARNAHAYNQTVQDSLKPIGTIIIPALNNAADNALKAEIEAQNARNTKIYYTIALLVFAGVTIGLRMQSGLGWALSCVAGGIAALVVGLVVGEIAQWIPYILGLAVAGVVVFFLEKELKGGWLAAVHDRWHVLRNDIDAVAVKYVPPTLMPLMTTTPAITGKPNDPIQIQG